MEFIHDTREIREMRFSVRITYIFMCSLSVKIGANGEMCGRRKRQRYFRVTGKQIETSGLCHDNKSSEKQ